MVVHDLMLLVHPMHVRAIQTSTWTSALRARARFAHLSDLPILELLMRAMKLKSEQ